MILAIDPGPKVSAYALLDNELRPVEFDICENLILLQKIAGELGADIKHFAIEMVASYGMPVGVDVFETVFWIGRFWEAAQQCEDLVYTQRVFRIDVKMNLCHNSKAKDGNIRQALIDRFGIVGTKRNQGWFYGVSKDVWSAIAVGVTYHDLYVVREAVS